jgi:FixJ family two-component response regulator
MPGAELILDMRMPPPNGVDLARQARTFLVNASTVIVMITGDEDRALMKRAFEAGVELFLFKPVERNKLLKLIRAAEGPIGAGKATLHTCAAVLQSINGSRQ